MVIRNKNTYKVVVLSENRATGGKYVDKVVHVTILQREYNRTNATDKIHIKLMETYHTKSRRYRGFQWVVDSLDIS